MMLCNDALAREGDGMNGRRFRGNARGVKAPKMVATVAVALAAALLPGAAGAQAFTWQQIYKCGIFSSAIAEYARAEGRKGDEFDQEWDKLTTAALRAHQKEYVGLRPNAKSEELRAAWELDTAAVERSYESDLDRSPDAREFLKQGYNQCAALRTTVLPKR